MASLPPLVSVILLSYDRPGLFGEALDSILRQSYQQLEIIVVDNKSASSPQIAEMVGQRANIRLIANTQNLGFTGGMNRGLREASGRYVYFTEDDVIVEENCISSLVEYMESDPATGLAAPIMYNKESHTIRSAGGEIILDAVFRKKIFGAGERDTGQFDRPFHVTTVPGAAVISRLELLRRLHGFREDFFMYAEDNELCLRVLKAGMRIAVVPQAKVFHAEPAAQAPDQKIEFHRLKNFFSLYLLHARPRVMPEFYLRYGVINLVRALVFERRNVWPMLRAWAWFLLRWPVLLRDRDRVGP